MGNGLTKERKRIQVNCDMVGKPDIKRISKKEGNISECDMVEKPEIKGISKERREYK